MSALQIVLISIIGVVGLVSIVFMFMFLAEILANPNEEEDEVEVKSVFSSETYVKETTKVEEVNTMLAKLDEEAKEEKEEEEVVEVAQEEPVTEEPKQEEIVVEETKVEEVKEESKQEEIVEVTEEKSEETTEENKEEAASEENVEPAEEVKEEVKEEVVEESKVEPVEEVQETETVEVNGVAVEGEPITAANLLDYKARLEKVIESRDKLNKDLIKIEKSILNYERTKRRKIRNQKMLDRRASELTNLNLVMYSVTDIKNVDEEKKVKQEELTTHIAELKASIQDAEEFLDSNKEKNEHDVKMAKFLIQEKARLKEEIAELEELIRKTEGDSAAV